jgi:hypothetical protein
LVAAELDTVADQIQHQLGLDQPYHDPGVAAFGLRNAVFSVGDTFVEVVSPMRPDTTAGRYLERRGGDSGYMAIFQVPHLDEARRRLPELGVRIVWAVDLDDIAGTHLHPKDVPGAIVSLDWAEPAGSWRWAGPAWTGREPAHTVEAITALTVEVSDPVGAARRWADVLGHTAEGDGDEARIVLDDGRQELRFVPAAGDQGEGITEVQLAIAHPVAESVIKVAGVRLVAAPA